MSTPAHDDPIDRARRVFEAQVDGLDPATATALRARRREAIAMASGPRRRAWWWPAGGLVTAALALALVVPRPPSIDGAPSTGTATPTVTDLASDGAAEAGDAAGAARFAEGALAELENDAAFYAWLATLPDDTNTPDLPPRSPHEG